MRMSPSTERRLIAVPFVLIAGAALFSVAGMALMRFAPSAVAKAGTLLPILMKTPTWTYMIGLPVLVLAAYWRGLGWQRSLAFLVWGSAVGLTAELLGTQTGWPFGEYSYTAFLGPKVAGHVPWLIPPSWYAMALVSFDLASRATTRRLSRIALAATYMCLWDVALDPAMGAGFPVWIWAVDGAFYGMPLINWVGWFVTSAVIMGGFEAMGGLKKEARSRWAIPAWGASMALPLGICVVQGMTGAIVAGVIAAVIPVVAPLRPAAWRMGQVQGAEG